MSPSEYDHLSIEIRDEFWEAITIMEARKFLVDMNLAMVPHMKDEKRQELHRKYHRIAYPETWEREVEHLTAAEIQKRLSTRS